VLWRPLTRFVAGEARLAAWAERRRGTHLLYEFARFGVKQAWACLFGAIMLALLIATHWWYPRDAALTRYDFLVVAAVGVQAAMLWWKLETWEEAKVILLFHVTGTVMEIFKTSVGSWIYPEPGLLKIAGVPLFTGFMYASVGSFIARCWRLFDFRFTHHPPLWSVLALAAAIYVNFFLHHYFADLRLALFAVALVLFGRTWIHYRVWRVYRAMPLLVACGLTALFIWGAENIGTLTRTWLYPNQLGGWAMVSFGKLSSWYLLLIISYAMVALVNRPEAMADESAGERRPLALLQPGEG
jgi:uncharacterized membrane protein YoaT (DUF817 family)